LVNFSKILIVLFLLQLSLITFSQENIKDKKPYKTATKLFKSEQYSEALPVFLELEKNGNNSPELNYNIGICYLNTVFDKHKAIAYLEKSISANNFEVPPQTYLEIGKLYHQDYNFDKALLYYNKYLFYAPKDDLFLNYAKRMVNVCNNAKTLIADSLDVSIMNLGKPINTFYSEYSPYISADESSLFFNKVTYINKNYLNEGIKNDSVTVIMVSHLKDTIWSEPEKIKIITKLKNPVITLEGVTPDGQNLFISITTGTKSDLYTCTLNGNNCDNVTKLPEGINSDYWEGRVSQTSDGTELYFSSNRPGGYGKKDIYKIKKDKNGNWENNAINLGPAINTFFDETSPFIHPDNKTLFFSSQGHMAIGGFDIFKSVYKDNKWSYSDNIGYPINTTKDDLYFVLSANGKSGYFSSSVNNKYENHDIYKVTLKKSIPLTLVKGTILAGNPPKPTTAQIKVLDKETNKKVKYIYNPNPNTGKYLMIFPPGKNYDMIINAPGFLPQLVNIYVPDQTYFYELYQEIILNRVNALGKKLGEKIIVNNTFYDIYKTVAADTVLLDKDTTAVNETKTKDYNQLLLLIEDIINTTDTVGIEILDEEINLSEDIKDNTQKKDYNKLFSLVEKAINTTDSVSLMILDKNTMYDEKTTQTYFYAENEKENDLVPTIIGSDTIYTTPPVSTENEDLNSPWPKVLQKTEDNNKVTETSSLDFRTAKPNNRKLIYTSYIFFNDNDAAVKQKYFKELMQISELLVNNPKIGIMIIGYTDTRGDKIYNLKLSNKRVNAVMNYFIDQGVPANKAILKGVGESKSGDEKTELDRKFNRRVDIQVFELVK